MLPHARHAGIGSPTAVRRRGVGSVAITFFPGGAAPEWEPGTRYRCRRAQRRPRRRQHRWGWARRDALSPHPPRGAHSPLPAALDTHPCGLPSRAAPHPLPHGPLWQCPPGSRATPHGWCQGSPPAPPQGGTEPPSCARPFAQPSKVLKAHAAGGCDPHQDVEGLISCSPHLGFRGCSDPSMPVPSLKCSREGGWGAGEGLLRVTAQPRATGVDQEARVPFPDRASGCLGCCPALPQL